MTTATAVLGVLVLGLAVLLSHPDVSSLRNRWTRLGLHAVAAGLTGLLVGWVGIEFSVLAKAYPDNCAAAFGVSPVGAHFGVREHFFPPSVDCTLDGGVRTLTGHAESLSWAGGWVVAWCLIGLGRSPCSSAGSGSPATGADPAAGQSASAAATASATRRSSGLGTT